MAGAKHVYAVECSGLGGLASQVFKRNGVSNKVTVIEGRSTDIELPEKASVLVSEIIGNDPLDEGVLPTTADAISRLLKPDARLIPSSIDIIALPVNVPEEVLQSRLFTEAVMQRWKELHDIDFSPFLEASRQQDHDLFLNTYKAKDWLALTDPIVLHRISLNNIRETEFDSLHQVTVSNTGLINGIIVYFCLGLAESVVLSIDPRDVSSDNSWFSKTWIPGESIPVKVGEEIELRYMFKKRRSTFNVEVVSRKG